MALGVGSRDVANGMTATTGQVDRALDASRGVIELNHASPRLRPSLAAWLLVFAVAAIVYWPWLGGPGFSMTEGHRAIPGFEMVERWHAGDRDAWWSPTLFGQVYVRKPPGVLWLIALSSMGLGETEFAARVPSAAAASLMALAALWFGTRWFARAGGLACGLAQALWPWMWSSGRTAEIEAVHNAFVYLSVLIVVERVVFATRRASRDPRATDRGSERSVSSNQRAIEVGSATSMNPTPGDDQSSVPRATDRGSERSVSPGHTPASDFNASATPPQLNNHRHAARELPWALTLGLAIAGAGLAKGPAGWPAIIATIIAGALVCGWRTTTRAWLLIALLIPAAIWGYVYLRMSHAIAATGQSPVTQGPSEFLWHAGKLSLGGIAKVLSMPLVALVSAIPASLALLFPWGGDAKREAAGTPQFQIARILSVACLGSLIALAVLGVDNPRYAMPSVCVVPMVVGYVVWGMGGEGGRFTKLRTKIARRLLVLPQASRVWISPWPIVLILASVASGVAWNAYKSYPGSVDGSGKWAGRQIASSLHGAGKANATVLADHLIEASPEVLWYAKRWRDKGGASWSLHVRWMPGLSVRSRPKEVDEGALVVLRTDPGSDEWGRAFQNWRAHADDRFEVVAKGATRKYEFTAAEWDPAVP